MRLVLIGITHHNCPIAEREKLAFSCQQQESMLRRMHTVHDISEAVILQTCNRTEFYIYANKNFDTEGFLAQLIAQFRPEGLGAWKNYSRQKIGMDVVRHLFEVAAGLDSQIIGENQILSQLKSAYAQSLDCHMSKFIFHRLFHLAFSVAKAVRTNTTINRGAVSIGLAAVQLAKSKIDLTKSSCLLIGAGENAKLIADHLFKAGLKNLTIANRNPENAKSLQAYFNHAWRQFSIISLADIIDKLDEIDLLISTTAASGFILTHKMVARHLGRRQKPLLIIDIAVPRDIDPDIAQFDCVTLINIDELNEQVSTNKEKRKEQIPQAQVIISQFTRKFESWLQSLSLVPLISQLTQKGIDLARGEAKRYAKEFARANPQEMENKLRLFAESLVRKVLHGPISFLKTTTNQQGLTKQLQAMDLINKMFFSK